MPNYSTPTKLKKLLLKTIENVETGEANLEEARTISQTVNSVCNVVRTEIKVKLFNKENKEKVKF